MLKSGVSAKKHSPVVALIAALTLLLSLFVPQVAFADWNSSVGRGLVLRGVNASGTLRLGPHYVETKVIHGQKVEAFPIWCMNAKLADPGPNEMTSIATLSTSHEWGPAELDLKTPQMAWLLNKYQHNKDNKNLAVLSYLVHVNFEQQRGRTSAQSVVNEVVKAVRTQLPQVEALAKKYVQEARKSAVISYEAGKVSGNGERAGNIHNIGVHPQNANTWLAGVPVTVTLSGPAVFTSNGKTTWSGKTASKPLTLDWHAISAGNVTYSAKFDTPTRQTLTKFGANGVIQDVLSYGNRPVSDPQKVTVAGPSWRVSVDFQPMGVSKVVAQEVSNGQVTDTFTTAVDKSYGQGVWINGANGKPVPVVYRASAYYAGISKPATSATVPKGAKLIGTTTFTASRVGQNLQAQATTKQRGWVTWVWEVRKADQGKNADYVHADWADKYGLAAETEKVVFPFRPMGASQVARKVVSEGDELVDTFTASADPQFMDGKWTRIGADDVTKGHYVPVVYRADLYYVSPAQPPATPSAVPASAELVSSMMVTAKGPGEKLTANGGKATKAGFYTWVWRVDAKDQAKDAAKWITTGWTDSYGLADETTSVKTKAQITSQLHFKETDHGLMLVDDVFVAGMPQDHPQFEGGAGFKPDTKTIDHSVYFFTLDQTVSDQNISKAQKIGQTVQIPAANGEYRGVSHGSWKVVTDKNGKNVPGTYVFVSRFAGDDRVAALTTSATDRFEQFNVPMIDSLLTFNNGKEKIPAYGMRDLVETVPLFNLAVGKEYTLEVTLVDQATGKSLVDKSGKPVTVSQTWSADVANTQRVVTFTVDASLYPGVTVVATDRLLQEGRQVALHDNLTDVDQTLGFYPKARIVTTALDKADMDHEVLPAPGQVIVDRVCSPDQNWIVGHKYTITATLVDENEKPIVDKSGKPVAVTREFTPTSATECALVEITFDASQLAGKKVIVFEDVYADGTLVGVHHDVKDEKQTVHVKEKPVPPVPSIPPTPKTPPLPVTGSSVAGLGVLGVVLISAGGMAILRRKH